MIAELHARVRRFGTLMLLVLGMTLSLMSCEGDGHPDGSEAASEAPRPDIVLILADDLGFGDPGVYNPNTRIPTPHIVANFWSWGPCVTGMIPGTIGT